jgi:hypothetical protein
MLTANSSAKSCSSLESDSEPEILETSSERQGEELKF